MTAPQSAKISAGVSRSIMVRSSKSGVLDALQAGKDSSTESEDDFIVGTNFTVIF